MRAPRLACSQTFGDRFGGRAGVLSLLFFFLPYLLNKTFRRVASRALSDWEAPAVGCSQLHGAVLGGWLEVSFLCNLFLQVIMRPLFFLSHSVTLAAVGPRGV